MIEQPAHRSLVEPVLSRVRRDPTSPALVLIADDGSEEKVSIGRLHSRAVGFARAFRENGVGPNQLVVLAAPFSLDLIAALWGVLYAGATASIFPHAAPMSDRTETLESNAALW